MKSGCRHWMFLLSFIAGLASCGGSGNSSNQIIAKSSANQIIAQSSSSESANVIPSQVVITQDYQTYTLDEDNVLAGEIAINLPRIIPSGENEGFTSIIHTRNGGVVEFTSNEISSTKIFFNYTPAEDFNGEDDCDVYLTQYSSDGGNKQKIKIIFQVRPIEDQNFKFEIINKKAFVAGDVVQLSVPYNSDTRALVPKDVNFRISIDDVPINYSISTDGLSFVMPSNLLAGMKALNVQFEYQGKPSNFTRTLRSKIDYGEFEYWLGDKERPGVTYVIIAEQRVDHQKYIDWVNEELATFLSHPMVVQHSDYWNFIVIKRLAPRSYAYHINEDTSPIIIADLTESGEAFIKSFVPNYDWVILNTVLEGRETGGYPMVLNFSSVNTILHEFGHVHAKLADEYADSSVNRDVVYLEGSNPNVTNFNNYESIPWKHWIVDETSVPGVHVQADYAGVGAFLGAFYTNFQYYRPMFRSLMKDSPAPFSPIDSEAWVLATYERMGILGSVTNEKNANSRTFNVGKTWDKNITRVDWFLNGIKQEVLTNQSTITVDENKILTNSYSVMAELTDLSGYVKNPHAYAAFKSFNNHEIGVGSTNSFDSLKNVQNENFQKQWVFEKSSAELTAKWQKQNVKSDVQTAINDNDWVNHKVVIENGMHRIVSSSRYTFQDTLRAVTAHSKFRAEIIDASGNQIYSIGIDNPYRYYHDVTGLVILKEIGNYHIKHPYVRGVFQIAIVDMQTNQRIALLDFAQ